MIRIVLLAVGYICGLFTTGYILARLEHKDLQHAGSGNIGATNSFRVMGAGRGALVLLGDLLKALIPVLVVRHIRAGAPDADICAAYVGLGAILGHDFPFYLNWNGGKGVSSTAGFLLAYDIRIGLTAIAIFLLLFALLRLVSLSSLAAVTAGAVMICLMYPQTEIRIIAVIIAALCIWRHRANIKRLLNGTESKLELRKGAHKA